jgi:hypothetical protein
MRRFQCNDGVVLTLHRHVDCPHWFEKELVAQRMREGSIVESSVAVAVVLLGIVATVARM